MLFLERAQGRVPVVVPLDPDPGAVKQLRHVHERLGEVPGPPHAPQARNHPAGAALAHDGRGRVMLRRLSLPGELADRVPIVVEPLARVAADHVFGPWLGRRPDPEEPSAHAPARDWLYDIEAHRHEDLRVEERLSLDEEACIRVAGILLVDLGLVVVLLADLVSTPFDLLWLHPEAEEHPFSIAGGSVERLDDLARLQVQPIVLAPPPRQEVQFERAPPRARILDGLVIPASRAVRGALDDHLRSKLRRRDALERGVHRVGGELPERWLGRMEAGDRARAALLVGRELGGARLDYGERRVAAPELPEPTGRAPEGELDAGAHERLEHVIEAEDELPAWSRSLVGDRLAHQHRPRTWVREKMPDVARLLAGGHVDLPAFEYDVAGRPVPVVFALRLAQGELAARAALRDDLEQPAEALIARPMPAEHRLALRLRAPSLRWHGVSYRVEHSIFAFVVLGGNPRGFQVRDRRPRGARAPLDDLVLRPPLP